MCTSGGSASPALVNVDVALVSSDPSSSPTRGAFLSHQPPPPPPPPRHHRRQSQLSRRFPGISVKAPLCPPSTQGRGPQPGARALDPIRAPESSGLDASQPLPQIPSRRRRAIIHGEASPGGTRIIIHAIQHPTLQITSSCNRRRRRRSYLQPPLLLRVTAPAPAGAGSAAASNSAA